MAHSHRALALTRLASFGSESGGASPHARGRTRVSGSLTGSWSDSSVLLVTDSVSRRPSSLCSEPLDDEREGQTAVPVPTLGSMAARAEPLLAGGGGGRGDLRRSGVYHATVNIIAEVMGAGVLSLPAACATLGWVLGVGALLLFSAAATYSGLLLKRAKVEGYPSAESFADLATLCVGPRFGRLTRYAILAQWTLLLPYFLITAASSLRLALPDAAAHNGESSDGF